MNWMVIAPIVAALAVVVLSVVAYDYRKKLKELEMSVRFDHLERKAHEDNKSAEREINEHSRIFWEQIDRINERLEKLEVKCVKNEYSCAVNSSRKR